MREQNQPARPKPWLNRWTSAIGISAACLSVTAVTLGYYYYHSYSSRELEQKNGTCEELLHFIKTLIETYNETFIAQASFQIIPLAAAVGFLGGQLNEADVNHRNFINELENELQRRRQEQLNNEPREQQVDELPEHLEQYARNLKEQESFRDAFEQLNIKVNDEIHSCTVLKTIPVTPVYLNGRLYELEALKKIHIQANGRRLDPCTREGFTWKDVQPGRHTCAFFENEIKKAKTKTKTKAEASASNQCAP